MGQIAELINGLKNFRTRSDSAAKLAEIGEEAVGPLLELLDGRNEALAWSAIRILGEIGSKTAVPKLIELLKDRRYSIIARDALIAITGEQHGQTYEEWAHLLEGAAAEVPAGSLLDLVTEALSGTQAHIEETSHGISVNYGVGSGRSQKLMVMETKDHEGIALVAVYTECGLAVPDRYEWALRKNLTIPHGGFAIRDIGDRKVFVAVNTMFRDGLKPQELHSAMRTLARRADKLEKQLTGKDEH